MEYLDIHAHVFPVALAEKAVGWLESYYGYQWEGKGTADDLLASDYPAARHDRAIDDVLKLGFTPEENEKIFHRNAELLLGL